jgi:hypothetical protein
MKRLCRFLADIVAKVFCNNIGTYRTCPAKLTMSVDRSKADLALGRIGAFTFAPLVSPSVMRG